MVLLCAGCLEWPPLGANFFGGGKKIPSNLILKVWFISIKLIPHMTLYHASWLRYGYLKFPGTPKFSKFQMPISRPLGVETQIFWGVLFISHFLSKYFNQVRGPLAKRDTVSLDYGTNFRPFYGAGTRARMWIGRFFRSGFHNYILKLKSK